MTVASRNACRSSRQRPVLSDVRVVEAGDSLAAAYAGRLLADLGAEVVKIERLPGGDPLRSRGPFPGNSPDRERSASFAYFHHGKKSIALDLGDVSHVTRLAQGADVLLRSSCDGCDWISDAELDEVERVNPGLVVTDISTFGRQSDDHGMCDLVALAAGGLLSLNATNKCEGDVMPLRYRGELGSIQAGAQATLATLGGLHARLRNGRGQRVDVSAQAAVASILATAMQTWLYSGVIPVPHGQRGVAPWGFYTCQDGDVLIQITEDEQWNSLLELLGCPEWGSIELFNSTRNRAELQDALDPLLAGEVSRFTVEEFLSKARQHGVAAAKIHSARDLLEWDHLRARNFITPIEMGEGANLGRIPAPTPPARFIGTSTLGKPRRSPQLGADVDLVSWEPRRTTTAHDDVQAVDSLMPLAGVRVIDMTWVWAGPFGAMQFAHLGAEVIKIESTSRIDVTRRIGPFAHDVEGINRSGYFNQYNQGKKSVLLNLRDASGLAILKKLIASADLIIDNMRAGALARLGLSFEVLQELNPSIVALSMTGFGEDGPERDRMAYGSIIDALSGVSAANGHRDGGPTDFAMSMPDPGAGIHAAIAGVAALYRARQNGRGERVEVSMLEAAVAAYPWPLLIEGTGGNESARDGNRDPMFSPHGVFRCSGDYRWIAIAVQSDEEFKRLAAMIGDPRLADGAKFATLASRKCNEDELEAIISGWTSAFDAAELSKQLRSAGVTAALVANVQEVAESEELVKRDFLVRHRHPECGDLALPGVSWIASRSTMRAQTAAPTLGQHTRDVLGSILNMTRAEIDELDGEGVLR